MAHEHLSAAAIVVFATIGAICGFRWRFSVRGTTLTAVAVWTTISMFSIAMVALFAASSGQASADVFEALRFAAATSVFCPLIARLGAKRPQHGAWQFVVVTLWFVLASPAVEGFVLRPDQPLEVVGVRSWFFLLLIAVGWFDRMLTRYAFAAFLAALGQLFLLGLYLPLPSSLFQFDTSYCVGAILVSLSVLLEVLDFPRRKTPSDSLDRLWLDFRDRFGTLWGLRILERLNDAASRYDWNLRLTWMGFRRLDAEGGELPGSFQTTFDNLLRRFVSPEWIASRQGIDVDC